MECLAFPVINILIISLKIRAKKAYYLSSARYCCWYYCCSTGLYIHCIASNQSKDANSTETQKSRLIKTDEGCVKCECCEEKILSKITCVRERMHFLPRLVNVASLRKSFWKEREAKNFQLRVCIFRDTIKKYLMQTTTALWSLW